jgi:Domain of unknown function (DUF4410)
MKSLLIATLLAGSIASGPSTPQRSAAVFRFAIASEPVATPATLSQQACLQNNKAGSTGNAANSQADLKVDPELVDLIALELQKRLSKKMEVTMDPDPKAIPVGALVITGCITRADPGNATGRLIGMTMGTSHLNAHVKVLSKRANGFVPVDEFDAQAKGGKILPPIGPVGLAAHAVAEHRETLSADATKLADQVLLKLSTTLKSQAGATKNPEDL